MSAVEQNLQDLRLQIVQQPRDVDTETAEIVSVPDPIVKLHDEIFPQLAAFAPSQPLHVVIGNKIHTIGSGETNRLETLLTEWARHAQKIGFFQLTAEVTDTHLKLYFVDDVFEEIAPIILIPFIDPATYTQVLANQQVLFIQAQELATGSQELAARLDRIQPSAQIDHFLSTLPEQIQTVQRLSEPKDSVDPTALSEYLHRHYDESSTFSIVYVPQSRQILIVADGQLSSFEIQTDSDIKTTEHTKKIERIIENPTKYVCWLLKGTLDATFDQMSALSLAEKQTPLNTQITLIKLKLESTTQKPSQREVEEYEQKLETLTEQVESVHLTYSDHLLSMQRAAIAVERTVVLMTSPTLQEKSANDLFQLDVCVAPITAEQKKAVYAAVKTHATEIYQGFQKVVEEKLALVSASEAQSLIAAPLSNAEQHVVTSLLPEDLHVVAIKPEKRNLAQMIFGTKKHDEEVTPIQLATLLTPLLHTLGNFFRKGGTEPYSPDELKRREEVVRLYKNLQSRKEEIALAQASIRLAFKRVQTIFLTNTYSNKGEIEELTSPEDPLAVASNPTSEEALKLFAKIDHLLVLNADPKFKHINLQPKDVNFLVEFMIRMGRTMLKKDGTKMITGPNRSNQEKPLTLYVQRVKEKEAKPHELATEFVQAITAQAVAHRQASHKEIADALVLGRLLTTEEVALFLESQKIMKSAVQEYTDARAQDIESLLQEFAEALVSQLQTVNATDEYIEAVTKLLRPYDVFVLVTKYMGDRYRGETHSVTSTYQAAHVLFTQLFSVEESAFSWK